MKIGIIGAGLSGLTCAWYFKKNNFKDITIFEASDEAGGKLKTDFIDGFQLDHGFQVLLTAYPETKKILDYDKLQLQRFAKGSLISKQNKKIPFYDPENGMSALMQTAINGPGTIKDYFLLLKLKYTLNQMSTEDIFNQKTLLSSHAYLKEIGFSEKIIQDFWIPFYQGVFLENTLKTDSKMLQFTFKMFAQEGAAVPKDGMGAIPTQLVDFIGSEKIRYKSEVLSFDSKSITTVDSKNESFDRVVLACNLNKKNNQNYHSVTNTYFETEILPIDTKYIILNANINRIINNVVMISNVAPSYSQNAKHLISTSANGINIDIDDLLANLKAMFGEQVNKWKFVKSYIIRHALPEINFEKKYEPLNSDGVYYCGDHLLQASINGAMESGRRSAEEIIKSVAIP